MKTLISLFLLLAVGASAATGIKISEYPNTPVLTNSELFIVAVTNVTPATNRNISYGQLRSLLSSNNFVGSFTGDGRNVSNVVAAYVAGTLSNNISGNAATATNLAGGPVVYQGGNASNIISIGSFQMGNQMKWDGTKFLFFGNPPVDSSEWFEVDPVITTNFDNKYGFRTTYTLNHPNTAAAGSWRNGAILGTILIPAGNTNDYSNNQPGVYGEVLFLGGGIYSDANMFFAALNHAGTGTISRAAGLLISEATTSSGHVVDGYALYMSPILNTSSGFISNFTGIYLGPQTVPGHYYGIYDAGTSTQHFGGALEVVGESRLANMVIGENVIGLASHRRTYVQINDDGTTANYGESGATANGYFSITGEPATSRAMTMGIADTGAWIDSRSMENSSVFTLKLQPRGGTVSCGGNVAASGAIIATNAFVMPPVSDGPVWCTNGLAAMWNSNANGQATIYLRTSAVGATTYADKLVAP